MENSAAAKGVKGRAKFIVGGLLIIAAVIYLVISSTQANAQYFMTIAEVKEKGASIANRELRLSGAVLGDSIHYDADTLRLTFTIADIPADNATIEAQGGLAAVLHNAVTDPNRPTLNIIYEGVKPDLLKNEAQAIITGKMGADGNFYANELLMKCPTKYEEAVPEQAAD
jgi:cytochrome c-type biogenesis protein CcmE